MKLDPKDVYQRLTEKGDLWAEAKYEADQLDDATKPLLSQLGEQSGEKSVSGKEAAAYRHADYKAHYTEKNKAKLKENKARVAYSAAQAWVEVMRTVAATERATNRSAT